MDYSLPIFQPERIRGNAEAHSFLAGLNPDVCVVVAFGQILPPGFFDLPPFGSVNVHASVLPAYRGAAPVAHAILNGEAETGVTIMTIDAGMDTGGILSIEKVPIPSGATCGELEGLLATEGARLLVPTLWRYFRGEIKPSAQDESRATMAPRIRRQQGLIDWGEESIRVLNRIRAMNPWPCAYSGWRSEEVKIWKAEPGCAEMPGGGSPGTILRAERECLEVLCGKGTLMLTELQLPNRKRVSAGDFINGTRARVGEVFQAPISVDRRG